MLQNRCAFVNYKKEEDAAEARNQLEGTKLGSMEITINFKWDKNEKNLRNLMVAQQNGGEIDLTLIPVEMKIDIVDTLALMKEMKDDRLPMLLFRHTPGPLLRAACPFILHILKLRCNCMCLLPLSIPGLNNEMIGVDLEPVSSDLISAIVITIVIMIVTMIVTMMTTMITIMMAMKTLGKGGYMKIVAENVVVALGGNVQVHENKGAQRKE